MPTDHSKGKWADALAPRKKGERRHWLVKSEPDVFSFDDLLRTAGKTTHWDGVRNFVARNFLRDGMEKGDLVFFYHSSVNPQVIVGICEVTREGYADASATNPKHPAFDPKSTRDTPTWFMVDLKAVKALPQPVTLLAIKQRNELAEMALLRIGRLSVTPVTQQEWDVICEMGGLG